MTDYQTALRTIVKILSPQSPADARRAFAVKLAEAGSGEIHRNLVFYYWHIGALFHPNDAAAAATLTDRVKTARESYELQSIIPRDMGGILAGDLLTWPECPPVTAENPLSFWLPVSAATSGTPEQAAPPDTTIMQTGKGITKQQVMNAFEGIKLDRDHWSKTLASPPKWLIDCRVALGNKNTSALWNPALIAAALHDKGISLKRLDAALIGLRDWADEWGEVSAIFRD